jgi:hypothetical protein
MSTTFAPGTCRAAARCVDAPERFIALALP